MRKKVLLVALAISAPLHATEFRDRTDRVQFDSDGSRMVVRAAENHGREDQVDQRLQVTEDGRLRYEFNRQDERTKAYHQAYCESLGMEPPKDAEILFEGTASGWHCIRVQELGPEDDVAWDPRSIDYVYAVAPSGSVQSGTNFALEASARFGSSVAGSIRVSSHVDNRCRSDFSQYYGQPFTGDHRAKVSCFAHQPGFMNSGTEACVPLRCGQASGTVSAR